MPKKPVDLLAGTGLDPFTLEQMQALDPNAPSAEQESIQNQMAAQVPDNQVPEYLRGNPQYERMVASVPPPPTPNPASAIAPPPQYRADAGLGDIATKLKEWQNKRDIEGDRLRQYMQDYARMPQHIDWSPAAQLIGHLNGNEGLGEAVARLAPESPQKKLENLVGMQQKLAQFEGDKSQSQAMIQLEIARQKAAQQQAMMAYRNQGLDIRRDTLAQRTGNVIDNDALVKKIEGQRQQIALDKHTLDNTAVLTPQIFDEIQLGIARAISGGGLTAVSTQDKVAYESAATQLAALKQRLANNPEDINSPGFKQAVRDTLDRLGEAYDMNLDSRKNQLAQGREAGLRSSPQAIEVLRAKTTKAPQRKEWNGSTYELQDGHWVKVK